MKIVARVCVIALSVLLFAPLQVAAQPKAYRSVQVDDKRIALTFDDGPHPRQTERILEILGKYNVKATFFMVGKNVELYPDVARRVVGAGCEIGNHTYSHYHVSALNEGTLREELERCREVLEEICGCEPRLFRPPEGKITSYVEACVDDEYELILWSLDTRDWEGKSASAIADSVMEKVHPGAIILLHDYVGKNAHTAEALEIFLPLLLSQGYEPVTVSELIGQ